MYALFDVVLVVANSHFASSKDQSLKKHCLGRSLQTSRINSGGDNLFRLTPVHNLIRDSLKIESASSSRLQ